MATIKPFLIRTTVAAALATLPTLTHAQVKVGVILSITGPGAEICVPQARAVPLLPHNSGGTEIDYMVVDDGFKVDQGVREARRLILEEHVDALIGPATTGIALAIADLAQQTKTPVITLARAAQVVAPADTHRWIFKTPQDDSIMPGAIVDHMVGAGVKSVAFLGFAEAYGEDWNSRMRALLEQKGIAVVAAESFVRNDANLAPQAQRIVDAHSDAVFIAAASARGAAPEIALRELGFTGPIYQTNNVATPEFLAAGGARLEGTLLPASPSLVAAQLSDDTPTKRIGMDFMQRYQALQGHPPPSVFAAQIYDAGLLLSNAIGQALPTAKPGTEEFRAAVRDALESTKQFADSAGIVTMSSADHLGLDDRARVMVRVHDGNWELAK